MYVQTRSIGDFAFIDAQSKRFSATLQFGKILRALYEHPDWSQIYNFCSKRYSKREVLSNRSARVLNPTKDALGYRLNTTKAVTVNFNTDPSSIGLPQDFITQIAEATRKAVAQLIGPDPINCSIGPTIGSGIGAASYMDLIYGGRAPLDTDEGTCGEQERRSPPHARGVEITVGGDWRLDLRGRRDVDP